MQGVADLTITPARPLRCSHAIKRTAGGLRLSELPFTDKLDLFTVDACAISKSVYSNSQAVATTDVGKIGVCIKSRLTTYLVERLS